MAHSVELTVFLENCSKENLLFQSYPVENLLKSGEYKKWICAKAGEKQASVVFQFEKSNRIHGLDIGNDGSAFIEVLVGRLSDNEQNYQVLLVASSFMSPVESRNGTNMNRVRMFDIEKFTKGVAEEKWDRVKVICTQPFNKNVQYGLTFIKFHSLDSDATASKEDHSSESQCLGAFTLRDDSKDLKLTPGSLFSRTKESSLTASNLKGALDIRAASTKAEAELLWMTPSEKASCTIVSLKRKTLTKDETELDSKKTKRIPLKAKSPLVKEKIPSYIQSIDVKQRSKTKLLYPDAPANERQMLKGQKLTSSNLPKT